jgi:hypothetical protein
MIQRERQFNISGRLQGYEVSSAEIALVGEVSGAQYMLVSDACVERSGNKMYTSRSSLVRKLKMRGEHGFCKWDTETGRTGYREEEA